MVRSDLGPQRIRVRVGDGTHSHGDIDAVFVREILERLQPYFDQGYGVDVEFGPGIFRDDTGCATWNKGACSVRCSNATVFVSVNGSPDPGNDALMLYVPPGTDDFEWHGGQFLGHIGSASALGEYCLVRIACNNVRVSGVSAYHEANPAALASRNFRNLFTFAFGESAESEPDLVLAHDVNNVRVSGCFFRGESPSVGAQDGRAGAIRARKVSGLTITDCHFGADVDNQQGAVTGYQAIKTYRWGTAVLLEDCYKYSITNNTGGADDFRRCFLRSISTEKLFDFAYPFSEAGHAIVDGNYFHSTSIGEALFDFRDGAFTTLGPNNEFGQILSFAPGIPVVRVRRGLNVARAVDFAPSGVPEGTTVRVQDGAGGDRTFAAYEHAKASVTFAPNSFGPVRSADGATLTLTDYRGNSRTIEFDDCCAWGGLLLLGQPSVGWKFAINCSASLPDDLVTVECVASAPVNTSAARQFVLGGTKAQTIDNILAAINSTAVAKPANWDAYAYKLDDDTVGIYSNLLGVVSVTAAPGINSSNTADFLHVIVPDAICFTSLGNPGKAAPVAAGSNLPVKIAATPEQQVAALDSLVRSSPADFGAADGRVDIKSGAAGAVWRLSQGALGSDGNVPIVPVGGVQWSVSGFSGGTAHLPGQAWGTVSFSGGSGRVSDGETLTLTDYRGNSRTIEFDDAAAIGGLLVAVNASPGWKFGIRSNNHVVTFEAVSGAPSDSTTAKQFVIGPDANDTLAAAVAKINSPGIVPAGWRVFAAQLSANTALIVNDHIGIVGVSLGGGSTNPLDFVHVVTPDPGNPSLVTTSMNELGKASLSAAGSNVPCFIRANFAAQAEELAALISSDAVNFSAAPGACDIGAAAVAKGTLSSTAKVWQHSTAASGNTSITKTGSSATVLGFVTGGMTPFLSEAGADHSAANLRSVVRQAWADKALRAFARVKPVPSGNGAFRCDLYFLGLDGQAPAAPTITLSGSGLTTSNTSEPYTPTDFRFRANCHWSSSSSAFNRPVLWAEDVTGKLTVGPCDLDHIQDLDPSLTTLQKRQSFPLVIQDCALVHIRGVSLRPYGGAAYNSGNLAVNFLSFAESVKPIFLRKTDASRPMKVFIEGVAAYGEFAGLFDNDGLPAGDVKYGINYVNGVVTASN